METPLQQILLVRHGTTEHNERDILQGHIDNPLNDRGQTEVNLLGDFLRDETIGKIYTSPLLRAMQTCDAINRYHQAPVTVISTFTEVDLGDWEGMTYAAVKSDFSEFHDRWVVDPAIPIPNGESFLQVFARVKAGVDEVLAGGWGTVVICGHATVNRAILAHLMKIDPASARQFRQRNASLSKFLVLANGRDRRLVIDFWNSVAHLVKES